MELSKSQLAVVKANADPLLVVAGPGAGKTTVLAARISRLLTESDGSYRKVLGITYTNVAANNLRDKIALLGKEASARTLVSTFHGFSARLLQQHGLHVGLNQDFAIVNEINDRTELLTKAAAKIGASPADLARRADALLRLLARLYERCTTSEDIPNHMTRDSAADLQFIMQIFDAYVQTSIEENQLEFSLLVYLATKLLREFRPLAIQTRQIYQYICVDEFQDTNSMQFKLLEAIALDDPSGLLLLADQDQIIYQWNGASPTRLREAASRFKATIMELPTSYRCPDDVVAAATRLISHNSDRFVNAIYDSEKHETADIVIRGFADEHEEAKYIAQRLTEFDESERASTVVLARNRKLLDVILQATKARDIEAFAPVSKLDFESPPMVMLQSMLRLANRANRVTVVRRLVAAFALMTGVELDADLLFAQAEEETSDVLSLFFHTLLPKARSDEFKRLAAVVATELVSRKEFRNISSAFFSWVDSLQPSDLKTAYQGDFDAEKNIWLALERRHRGLADEQVTLAEFLRNVDLESKVGEPKGAVRLLTVHGAKGLEFDHVFLAGAAENQFPTYQAVAPGASAHALEEERRSFFVAITRSMKSLTLSYADKYFGRQTSPSRFIAELEVSG